MSVAAMLEQHIEVRLGMPDDYEAIMALRDRQMREEIGHVPLIPATVWMVATEGGVIHAAGGGVLSSAPGYPNTAIVTDLLDDGTRAGKRCLLALIEDAISSPLELYVTIPKDREGLRAALEARGMELDGFQMRRKRSEPRAE